MKRTSRTTRYLVLILGLLLMGTNSTYAAPQYPPSIQKPQAGEPIIAPTKPLTTGAKVSLPVAQVAYVPDVNTSSPKSASTLEPSARVTSTSFSKDPVALTKNILIGGVQIKDLATVPRATFACEDNSQVREVQMAEDVPTVITITTLLQDFEGGFIKRNGSKVTLSRVKADKSLDEIGVFAITIDERPRRTLTTPPITILKKSSSATFQILFLKKPVCTFIVRAVS